MLKFARPAVLALALCLIGFERSQAAYIDPNTGGLLFQLLAVLFTIGSSIVLFFSSRIRMTIARIRRSQRDEDNYGEETRDDLA